MLDLTRSEKVILLFLTLSLTIGVVVTTHQKLQRGVTLEVQPGRMAALESADRLIEDNIRVNINSGQIDQLVRLPGVGQTIAQRIAAYQKLHGPFTTKEQLLQVEGIGQNKFERIKDLITLE